MRHAMQEFVYVIKNNKILSGYINVIEEFSQRGDKENIILYGITENKYLPLRITNSLDVNLIGRFENLYKTKEEAEKHLLLLQKNEK